jgi:type III restriction enzyme
MMSFRAASDATLIAQLVGRMVRTPLARRVDDNEYLNGVALYLPGYDIKELKRVTDRLTQPDPDIMPPVTVKNGEDSVILTRAVASEAIFIALEEVPSYTFPIARKISEVTRLMKLARQLSRDGIVADAPELAKRELLDIVDIAYSEQKATERFKRAVDERGKLDIQAVDWRFSVDLDESRTIRIDMATENLDELFEAAGRKLGEGLHKEWWRSRVTADPAAKTRGKLELIALCLDPDVLKRVETTARNTTQNWLRLHQSTIKRLPEAQRQAYDAIYRTGREPQETTLILPTSIESGKTGSPWTKHLYVDDAGTLTSTFNTWETKVLEVELARPDVVGWLRNPAKKSWSLSVPYDAGDGHKHPLFPDFLVVRSDGTNLSIDLLDPHLTSLEDAWYKARGLAKYADQHGLQFGRIEMIIVDGEIVKKLDLCDEQLRKKVLTITSNEQLRQLFDEVQTSN